MNGKHRTLLTWLGKSLRPVATIASGRSAATCSGRISGSGLASARISGFGASSASHSGFSTRGAERPRNTSAPPSTSLQRARVGVARVARHVGQHARAVGAHHAGDVGQRHVLRPQSHRHQQIDAGQRRGAGAGGDQPHIGQRLALQHQPVAHRGGDGDRGAVLVVVEHRDAHAAAQLRLDGEAFRRLDVLQVDRAEGRLQRRNHIAEARAGPRHRPRCRTRRCRRIS